MMMPRIKKIVCLERKKMLYCIFTLEKRWVNALEGFKVDMSRVWMEMDHTDTSDVMMRRLVCTFLFACEWTELTSVCSMV